jgi:hypothetical protein
VLAHGITLDQMVELIRAGLATATAERVVGGKAIEVARVRIATAVPGLRTSSVRQWAARNTNKAPAGAGCVETRLRRSGASFFVGLR